MDAWRTAMGHLILAAGALAAAGCSMTESIERAVDAGKEIRKAEEALANGDYGAGLRSYMKAERLLRESRDAGYRILATDKEMDALKEAVERLEEDAESEGLVRVDDGFLDADELGGALKDALSGLFGAGQLKCPAHGRVVPDAVTVAVKEMPGGSFDVAIGVVVREAEEGGDFPQDAWGVARFILEGGYGHGFSHHIGDLFPNRPWMGTEAGWGASDGPGVDNHRIALDGRVSRLIVSVYRGRHRQGSGERYGPYGFKELRAEGPYWQREHFRSYSLLGKDAAQFNWEQADRIPDATLYGVMAISEEEPPEESGVRAGGENK